MPRGLLRSGWPLPTERFIVGAGYLVAVGLMVAVDGGVSEASVEELVRAGANRLIIGHALADSSNPAKTYMQILERAQKGCAPLSGVVV